MLSTGTQDGVPQSADDLIIARENQWFERKSGRVAAKDLAKALVGFANAEGGRIAVGIHNGAIDAPSAAQQNALRQTAHDFTVPNVRVHIETVQTDAGAILLFDVAPGEAVHETNTGDCFLRVGDETRKLSFAQRRELEFDRGSAPFDGTLAPDDAVSPERVRAFQETIGSSSPELALRARNLLTADGRMTVAGYLMFNDHPQTAFPNAYVRILKYGDVQRGTGQRQTLDGEDHIIDGPLPDQISSASEVIGRLMPKRRALHDETLFSTNDLVPKAAWMEALVNAVAHRSYSMIGDHIRVEIFPNRIEVTSPGRFPGLVNPDDPLSIHRHARNPRIARALAELGYTQELGEGIKRIFEEMRRRGLTDPLYEQTSGAVRITLSGADALPPHVTEALPAGTLEVLDALRRANQPLGTGEVADLVGIARPTAGRHLKRLRHEGLVEWIGQSPQDPRASWRIV